MAPRRKKGRPVTGWLCLDKPAGMTSTDAVASVKRLFDAAKVGHGGTLDPLATGALPIAFGEATKTVPFVQDGTKIYRFTVRWGAATDTDDTEGRVVATSDVRPTADAIRALLPEFLGTIMQRPPAYSALKIDGARAYDLARGGAEVVLEPRAVTIDRLALIESPDADHALFEAECGKGTYVRALARDFGERLGCFGHVVALRRLSVGPFDEGRLVALPDLIAAREAGDVASLDRFLSPLGLALAGLPEIALSGPDVGRVARGQSVLIRGRDAPVAGALVRATNRGEALAIGEIAEGAFHPKRVFGK